MLRLRSPAAKTSPRKRGEVKVLRPRLPLFALPGRYRRRPALCADDADLVAVGDAVGRRVDDAIVHRDARRQFDIAPEVARDLDGLEQYAIIRPDDRNPQP